MSNSCLSQDLHQPIVLEYKRAGAQMKIDPIMQIMQKEDEQQPNGCIMQILAMCLTTTKNPQLEKMKLFVKMTYSSGSRNSKFSVWWMKKMPPKAICKLAASSGDPQILTLHKLLWGQYVQH